MNGPSTVAIWHAEVPSEVRRTVQREIDRVLRSGRMIDGPLTQRLEDVLGGAFGRTAVAVASGMDALELLLEAVQARGRTVLVPANCFPSIPALALALGARPRPVPIDPVHLSIAQDVTGRTADEGEQPPVVLWVHHAGMVAPYARDRIAALRRSGCTVIEDCAYLLPGQRPADGPGTWGDAAILSFAPTKPLSGAGGGMILAADSLLADSVRSRRWHSGQEPAWRTGESFLRGRGITEPAAALAYGQWQRRAHVGTRLRRLARLYAEHFAQAAVAALPHGRKPALTWGRFTVDLGSPDLARRARQRMAKAGIATTVMFDQPWHTYPHFASCPPPEQRGLTDLLPRTVCIPYHPALPFPHSQLVAEHITHALTRPEGLR